MPPFFSAKNEANVLTMIHSHKEFFSYLQSDSYNRIV